MARRGYDEGCLAAHALNLIGDRWALLVLRELMLGPKRFGLIKAGLPGIASNVLTTRLEGLLAAQLLDRCDLPDGAPGYRLTGSGLATKPILRALCLFGLTQPGHDPRKFISPTALMLSMSFLARPCDGRPIEVGFLLEGERFATRLDAQGFAPRPDPAPAAPVLLEGSGSALAAAIYGTAPLADMAAAGFVTVRGDRALGQRFVDHFALG